ncbi:MAG: UdgX family uracil-DNA binding protein, partial [Burkholderiaceae bacterium]
PAAAPLELPADWVSLARTAALHADAQRWALIYRLALRLHRQPALAGDPLDHDLRQLERLAHAVRREAHKMKAFVRFRPVAAADGEVRHIAWFEPEHHVQERVAPFFARRFTQMHWLILTPRISLAWDGATLTHLPGAQPEDAPDADAGEDMWLAYYRSIFNPARVKVAMMKREMPVRFWANLPEARQIGQLLQQAPERTATMLADGAAASAQRQRARGRAVDHAVARLPSTSARTLADGRARFQAPPPSQAQPHLHADTLDHTRAGARTHITADAQADVLAARQAALNQLSRRAAQCRGCVLADAATQTVFGEGPADARLMLVGEQPGDREDLAGRPFVGPAGQLLRRTLAQLGWDERRLYLTNAVKHFKHELRGKRRIHKTASQQEAAACIDWLEAEIDAVQPDWLVALGATAAHSLLGRAVAVRDPAGPWWWRADGRPVLVVLHPSALLRLPDGARPAALHDWQMQLAQVDALAGAVGDWRA